MAQLVNQIFGPLLGTAAFAGVHSIARVILKCGKTILPKSVTEGWTILNQREDILDIVADQRDIPHWWSESYGKNGAHRDPTDPREYWCWRRCLSSENPITVRDVYNPDPATWLDGCDTHAGSATLTNLAESMSIRNSRQVEEQAHRKELEEASKANGKPYCQSNDNDSKSVLCAIEECDESEDSIL